MREFCEMRVPIVSTKEFLRALETPHGAVIAYRLTREGYEWIRATMPTEESKELWKHFNKCFLDEFNLQLLVDDDLYKPISLDELYGLVIARSQAVATVAQGNALLPAARKIGEV